MPTRRKGLHGWTPLDSDIRLAGGEEKLWGTHLSQGSERKRCFALWNQIGSSALLHPNGPRAAKHGCWRKTLVSGEAGGLSGFPVGALPAAAVPAAAALRHFLSDG